VITDASYGTLPPREADMPWLRQAGNVVECGLSGLPAVLNAKALAATDPGRAARLLTDAERAAQSITSDRG
jgi:hypothetical protein